MGTAVGVTRSDHTALELRYHASKSTDGAQVRRLLALASVVEGRCRGEAAALGGMDRQTLRDWIHRHNEAGTEGLKSRRSPGQATTMSAAQMAELKAVVLAGPDPAEHYLRENILCSRVWDTYDDIVEACWYASGEGRGLRS